MPPGELQMGWCDSSNDNPTGTARGRNFAPVAVSLFDRGIFLGGAFTKKIKNREKIIIFFEKYIDFIKEM